MVKFINKFKRITSSGNYIAEVDGLRFLAIFSVIIFHVRGTFLDFTNKHPGNTGAVNAVSHFQNSFLYRFINNGHQGVEIFFAISGFILALPFINHYRYGGKELTLKKFYLRRVTRLEPPYILALIILAVGVLINGEYKINQLFPSFMASLIYGHDIIFKEWPRVSTILWSLEVEVQFYLLTPFILRMYYWSKWTTRSILTGIIILMPFIQNVFVTDFNWLYKFIQYFAVGILVADLYLDKKSILYKLNNWMATIAGLFVFIALVGIDGRVGANVFGTVTGEPFFEKALFPFLILLFFMVVTGNSLWKKIFSVKIITIIGGMCYSIYLLHTAIISFLGRYVYKIKVPGGSMWGRYIVSFLILATAIIIISSFYFLLIERPCMQRDWYKKIFKKHKQPVVAA